MKDWASHHWPARDLLAAIGCPRSGRTVAAGSIIFSGITATWPRSDQGVAARCPYAVRWKGGVSENGLPSRREGMALPSLLPSNHTIHLIEIIILQDVLQSWNVFPNLTLNIASQSSENTIPGKDMH